uniref:Uncharacterized protein n=1 Tax=Timema bartmani TaxID=61472 RepID=A0A7R9HZ20_9NEOP|nr:unnamed protein product [Timema bartmani]
MSARTMFVTQEGPANALALNKDNSQVVIAGRNVFKIFTIGEDEFLESCNLRVGKNLNLNFSSNDVAWNVIEGATTSQDTTSRSPDSALETCDAVNVDNKLDLFDVGR